MGKTYVLDRVAADLARGFTHPAIQRLSSLVAAYPNDLDLRRRLAAVHRKVGNRIQAGRWDYLTIGADSRDTRAFERAFPSAVARLRQVRWPYRASEAATAYARRRLAKLIAAAEAERPNRSARSAVTGPPSRNGARPGPGAAGSAVPVGAPAAGEAPTSPRGARGVIIRAASRAQQWLPQGRPARVPAPAVVTTVVVAPLVVVGMVTVVEWFLG